MLFLRVARARMWHYSYQTFSTMSSIPLAVLRDPDLIDQASAPSDFGSSAVVYANVISETEADVIVSALGVKLKRYACPQAKRALRHLVSHRLLNQLSFFPCVQRRRYEQGHWDSAIVKYKETELDDEFLTPDILAIFDRLRVSLTEKHLACDGTVEWLPCHAIDLHADGQLNPHVDSVRFSGEIVAGLSLLSPSIMRLKPSEDAIGEWKDGPMDGHVDLLLPPCSLYCLSGPSRFRYSHELLASGLSFRGQPVTRDHRLSIVFRDIKGQAQ
jgi:alkylated DNA repair protein alkB family protein 7